MTAERRLHLSICKYLAMQYPGTIFTTESSGLSLSMGFNALLARLRSSPSLPDLWIMKPKVDDDTVYCGMMLEIKASRSDAFRKDGSLRQLAHIHEQNATISEFIGLGYFARFVCGFDEAQKTIDWYMKLTDFKI